MPKRSNRTPTVVEHSGELESKGTLLQLLELLQRGYIGRVTLQDSSAYCSKILSDGGAQFIVYTGDGVNTLQELPEGDVVVKCARLPVSNTPIPDDDGAGRRERAVALYREIQVLIHPRLQSHHNIVRLLWYDFVNAGDSTYIPALIMERAPFGTLSSFLLKHRHTGLGESLRTRFCADVTSGLHALHRAGVVHGDVKTNNVLVFASSTAPEGYVAKISDFGSAIIVGDADNDSPGPWRYRGTPTTNAPEVHNQTNFKLTAAGLRKCDNYSLGLLILEVVVGPLDSVAESKTAGVLPHSLELISREELSEECRADVGSALQKLLPYEPGRRCGDLAVIEPIFSPLSTGSLRFDIGSAPPTSGTSRRRRDNESVAAAAQRVFGLADYLSIDVDIELVSERDTQKMVLDRLLRESKSHETARSGKALFQLAVASAHGFGTAYSEDAALRYVVESARKGYLPAQANATAFHTALGRQSDVGWEEQIDWLFEATAWGSYAAGLLLRRMSLSQFDEARDAFHRAGGFNQFFFSQEPPSYIHSSEFAASPLPEGRGDLATLAYNAAIYGDAKLLGRLVENSAVDPDLTNEWSESLMLLCCKGGHLECLKVLVEHGASPDNEASESPAHWLVAFDDAQVGEAGALLGRHAAAREKLPEVTWNHPSVDLAGRFPIGSPLHYTTFCDSAVHTRAVLDSLAIPVGWRGDSELSPVEYGIPRRKMAACTELIERGALGETSEHCSVLQEIGMTPTPETWVAMASTQLSRDELAERCLDLVLSRDGSLLDQPGDGGFTPLMGAALYHDCATLRALLRRGCRVNAQTPREWDGRTALHLVSDNKMHLPPDDDTLDQLVGAGADLTQRSEPGGKLALHFAARDDAEAMALGLLALGGRPGTEVDARTTDNGQTALHIAAQYGSARVAAVLLDHGADPEAAHGQGTLNAFDWDRLTPLAAAACMGHASMAELLLTRGASALARPPSGHTVLHLAAAEPDGGRMLTMLLGLPALRRDGAVIDHQAQGGVTALHLCAGNLGRAGHLALLLDAGADPNVCTESGHSALDAAQWMRKRLADFEASVEKARLAGEVEEVMQLAAHTLDLWEPITIGRGKVSKLLLSFGEGEDEMRVDPTIDEGAAKAGRGEEDGGRQEHDSESKEEGREKVEFVDIDKDDGEEIEPIRVRDLLRELDGCIKTLLESGGRECSSAAMPTGLFRLWWNTLRG